MRQVPQGVSVKRVKLADVLRLLQLHYGENWHEDPLLEYYTKVFNAQCFFPGTPSSGPTHQGTEEDHQDEEVVMELEIIGNEVNVVGGDPNFGENQTDEPDEMDFELMESDEEEMI